MEKSSTITGSTSAGTSSGGGIGTLEYNYKKMEKPMQLQETDVINEEDEEDDTPQIELSEPKKKSYEEFMKEEEDQIDLERLEKERLEKESKQKGLLNKLRVKRRSTKREKKHHVEEVELDFFDDDEDLEAIT